MSFQRNLLGRFASLESDVPQDDLEIDPPEEGVDDTGAQLDGENIVEGDLVEAADDQAEITEADGEAEELEDTSDSLESFLMAAQVGRAQGGWNEREALAYGLGIDAVLKRVGGSSSDVLPSLESFGVERERVALTASVENRIKDAIMAIWEGVKRAVNKVIAFVRKWWIKIADGASRLKKRAEAIRKKAENTTGTAKEKKIRTSTLQYLHKGKSMPAPADLVATLKLVTESTTALTASRVTAGYSDAVDNIVKALTDVADGEGTLTDSKAQDAVSLIRGAAVFSIDLPIAKNKGSSDDISRVSMTASSQNNNVELFQSAELPGGRKISHLVITSSKGDVASGQYGRNVASSMRVAGKVVVSDYSNKKVEIDSSKEVAILEPSQVVSIADQVIDFCQVVVDYKLDYDKYEKHNSAAMGKADATLRKANNQSDDAAGRARGEFVRGLAQGLGSVIRNRNTSVSELISYGMTLSRNSLIFGVQSLAKYKD